MRSKPSKNKRSSQEDGASDQIDVRPVDVEFDTAARTMRVYDGRLINAEQRGFCRRLLEAAARRPGIGKAEVDLSAASCRIEFAIKGANSQSMADFFAECVREAANGFRDGEKKSLGRSAQSWTKMTAYPLEGDVSLWETFGAGGDRVKLRHEWPGGGDRQLPLIAEAISCLDDVDHCKANRRSRSLSVDLRHSCHELNGFVDQAERRFEELLAVATKVGASESGDAPGAAVEVATGPKRVMYLALAGGSFAMTVVGLVVPGVPTVPFLLATSYCLSRSSRWLDEKLRGSVFFGEIVTDWEEHGGLGWRSKAKLMALTGTIVAVAILLSPLTVPAIMLLIVISSLSAYGVYRLPGIETERSAGVSLGPQRLALPTPS